MYIYIHIYIPALNHNTVDNTILTLQYTVNVIKKAKTSQNMQYKYLLEFETWTRIHIISNNASFSTVLRDAQNKTVKNTVDTFILGKDRSAISESLILHTYSQLPATIRTTLHSSFSIPTQ